MYAVQRPLVFMGQKNIRKVVLSVVMRMILWGPKNSEKFPKPAKILSLEFKNDFSRSIGVNTLIPISLVMKRKLSDLSGLGRTKSQ